MGNTKDEAMHTKDDSVQSTVSTKDNSNPKTVRIFEDICQTLEVSMKLSISRNDHAASIETIGNAFDGASVRFHIVNSIPRIVISTHRDDEIEMALESGRWVLTLKNTIDSPEIMAQLESS